MMIVVIIHMCLSILILIGSDGSSVVDESDVDEEDTSRKLEDTKTLTRDCSVVAGRKCQLCY
jgi:hypothetical protein